MSGQDAAGLADPALQEEVVQAVLGVDAGLRAAAEKLTNTGDVLDSSRAEVVLAGSAQGAFAGDFTIRMMGVNNYALVFWKTGGQAVAAEDLANVQPFIEIEYKSVKACLRLSSDGSTISQVPATAQLLKDQPKASALVSFQGCQDGMGTGNW